MDQLLTRIGLFANLPERTYAELEGRMRRCDFVPHATIAREGGPGDAAFFVLSGLVAVRRRDAESGFEFLLAELGPGEMVGELSLLTGKPRGASVVALQATTCA